MSPALVVTLILLVGATLVVVATLADRRSARLAAGQSSRTQIARPGLGLEAADQEPPSYLTADELLASAPAAARFSPEQERELTEQLRTGERIDATLASPNLATHSGERAILDRPLVLVCADTVASSRELLRILGAAAQDRRPLLIAAPAMAEEALQTIIANRLAGYLEVAVVFAAEDALTLLATACGSAATDQADRMAGLPQVSELGHCGRALASDRGLWILDEASPTPDDPPRG